MIDAVAIILAAAAVVLVLVLWAALARLRRHVRQLEAEVSTLRGERTATAADLERVDVLIGRADKISSRVESASRLAYDTFATPVIKAMAVGKGTSQAARTLRQRSKH